MRFDGDKGINHMRVHHLWTMTMYVKNGEVSHEWSSMTDHI